MYNTILLPEFGEWDLIEKLSNSHYESLPEMFLAEWLGFEEGYQPPRADITEWLKDPDLIAGLKEKQAALKAEAKGLAEEIRQDFFALYRSTATKWFGELKIRVFKGVELALFNKQIRRLSWTLLPPAKKAQGRITEQDIQRAKEYPFSNLIEVNRAGFALCPFHSEKTPSFKVFKDNGAKCFGCGKVVDTIQFVMDTKGLTFVEAVRALT